MGPSPAPAPAPPAPSIVYGVAKAPSVQDLLRKQTASIRQHLEDAISNLSYNPRPPNSKVSPISGLALPILELLVETTSPKYLLVYFVEDNKEKVTLMAIQTIFV
jgi:hypothetical protein